MIIKPMRSLYVHKSRYFAPHELYDDGQFEPGEKLIFGPTLLLADAVRAHWGPLTCNAGVRTSTKQAYLKKQGYRTATYSPHVIGRTAIDLDTKSRAETVKLKELIIMTATKMGLPVRVGWHHYLEVGQTFVHMDLAPMIAVVAYRMELIDIGVLKKWSTSLEW